MNKTHKVMKTTSTSRTIRLIKLIKDSNDFHGSVRQARKEGYSDFEIAKYAHKYLKSYFETEKRAFLYLANI